MDRRAAIKKFSQAPLKHPMSKALLEFLIDEPGLVDKISFVENRYYYPDTLLVSEQGSPQVSFELELGAHQFEEVTLINGRMIRHTKRNSVVRVNDPIEAIEALLGFTGTLYVVFAFAGPVPSWYKALVEAEDDSLALAFRNDFDALVGEIISEQIDLFLDTIILRRQIEMSLKCRDKKEFQRVVPQYKKNLDRCLWRFE